MLRYALLIALAVTLTPVLAFDAGLGGARADTAAVATDSGAFVVLTNFAPTPADPLVLNNANGFEADLLAVSNQYTTPLAVQGSLLDDVGGRFKISNPAATLAPGAQHTFKVEDQAQPHTRGCFALTVRTDAHMGGQGAAREGQAIIDRIVHVQVGNRC